MSRSHTVCREYADISGSNKQRFLESLTPSKVLFGLDWQESETIQKFNENVTGLRFVHNFFTENVWELVTAPSESSPTRQNGGENRDKAYPSIFMQLGSGLRGGV